MKKFFFTGLFICQLAGYAQATASFTASVTIIEPLSVTTRSNMNFAQVDARSGGTVVLTTEGSRYTMGGVELKEGESVSPATFVVSGEKGLSVSLSIPQEEYFLSNGKESIILKDFTSNLPENFQLTQGSVALRIGASLQIQPQQVPGLYESTQPLKVTVNYN